MSSIFLKVKDTFTKASKKGIECDMVYLTTQDYKDFCSEFKMDGVSDIDINGIKLSIIKIEGRDKSYLNIKSTSSKPRKKKGEEEVTRYYI